MQIMRLKLVFYYFSSLYNLKLLKREKQSSSMAPVIDLSTDKRKQKINEIIINQTPPIHSKVVFNFNLFLLFQSLFIFRLSL